MHRMTSVRDKGGNTPSCNNDIARHDDILFGQRVEYSAMGTGGTQNRRTLRKVFRLRNWFFGGSLMPLHPGANGKQPGRIQLTDTRDEILAVTSDPNDLICSSKKSSSSSTTVHDPLRRQIRGSSGQEMDMTIPVSRRTLRGKFRVRRNKRCWR
jgi:hypothetical protein